MHQKALGLAVITRTFQMSIPFACAATLIQTIDAGLAGSRPPIVQGTSLAFMPTMIPLFTGEGPKLRTSSPAVC